MDFGPHSPSAAGQRHAAPTELGGTSGSWGYKYAAPMELRGTSGSWGYKHAAPMELRGTSGSWGYKQGAPMELRGTSGSWGYRHGAPDGALCLAATEIGPPGVFGWLRQPTGTGRLLPVSLPRQHCGRGRDGRRVSRARPPAHRLSWGQNNPEPNVVVAVGRVVVVAVR